MWMARRDGLIVTSAGEDTVVYDEGSQELHHLNLLAALVWQAADGQTSSSAMLDLAQEVVGSTVSAAAIDEALQLLAEANLIVGGIALPATQSRRRLMRGAALGAVVLPTVISVTAPMAAAASSVTCVSPPRPLVWIEFRRVDSDGGVCTPRVYATGFCPNTAYTLTLTASIFGGGQLDFWSMTVTADGGGQIVLSPIGNYTQSAVVVFVANVGGVASGPYPSVCQR